MDHGPLTENGRGEGDGHVVRELMKEKTWVNTPSGSRKKHYRYRDRRRRAEGMAEGGLSGEVLSTEGGGGGEVLSAQ